jgi:5-carboxymethyl-2-hydroxymuconate isomerase
MPHCILEYSANVADSPDFKKLLKRINETLAATGLFVSGDIKSRAIRHELFVVGDGSPDRSFVTLNLQILSGREEAVKAMLAEKLLDVLREAFPSTLRSTRCSLTVQVSDIHKPSYRRVVTYET